MDEIKSINKELDVKSTDIEEIITNLSERNEFICTGDACAGHAEGI